MRKDRRIEIVCLAAAVLLTAAGLLLARRLTRRQFSKPVPVAEQTLLTDEGPCVLTETSCTRRDGLGTLQRRCYKLPNGDTVTSGRLSASEEDCDYGIVERISLSGKTGTLWWFDPEADEWKSGDLSAQTVTSSCMLIQTPSESLFFWRPISYRPIESGCLRETASYGWLKIRGGAGGYTLLLYSSYLRPGEFCDYTVVISSSDTALPDLHDERTCARWKNYTQTQAGRWCFDGYYHPSPDSYVPTDCLYRCPAAYLAGSMVKRSNGCRLADDLSLMMLDTMRRLQNEAGYVPTLPRSEWLYTDYGLEGGFFDTRFNADLIAAFCRSHWASTFSGDLERWLDYYLEHAEALHWETENGWLVCDYGTETCDGPKTLTALNHQAAEISALLLLEDVLQDPRIPPLAERMLQGITDCGEAWLREDGNLYYARYPDGSFGGTDYPYLTYNDLLKLEELLQTRGHGPVPLLDRLIDAKGAWMETNGVTVDRSDD